MIYICTEMEIKRNPLTATKEVLWRTLGNIIWKSGDFLLAAIEAGASAELRKTVDKLRLTWDNIEI